MVCPAISLFFNHSEQIILFHHEEFVAVDLHGLAAVLAEQNAVTDLHVHGQQVTLVGLLAWAYGQDFALIGLFSRAVRNDDARGGFGFVFDALNNHAVCQRTQFHRESPWF